MRRIVPIIIAIAAGFALAPAAASADAPGRTLTIKGKERNGVVTFRAPQLKGKKVRSISVRVGSRRIQLSKKHRSRLVRTGVLTIRATKSLSRRKRRTLAPAAPAPAPAPAPTAPAPAPAPAPVKAPELVVVVDAPAPAPAPSPAPTAPGCPASEGSFGVGAWPSACWRPYSDDSPFNRRIGASPRVHSRSAAFVGKLTSFGPPQALPAGAADTAEDWAHPTYYNQATDPLFTIRCAEAWGRCPIEGMQVRIPDRARAAAGGDGHMAVVDQASGWEYDFWQVRTKPAGGGTITISWGGRTRIDGDGLGSSATAANFGNLAGVIRAQELAAGEIRHALFMTAPCDAAGAVYPASKGGSHCASGTTDAFPMGSRFQLDMSDAEIDALNVPRWKKAVLKAMANYGMYFGDTGGRSWAVQLESGSTYTSFGVADPAVGIAQAAGVPAYDGIRWMDLAGGVDWKSRLRVLDPCTAQGTC